MSKVYIVSAKRTPIGSFLGTLSKLHPAKYASDVVKNMLEETKVPAAEIDELVIGNILPAGLGQGMGRQVSIGAGIPVEVPAYSLNMVCGSGMKSVMNSYVNIKANMFNLVIAGGTESMSKAPYLVPDKTRGGIKMGGFKLKDHMIDDALTDAFEQYHMGITAENIVDKYNLTREEQDAFAINSQAKAIKAIDEGKFKDEIVPIEVKSRRETIIFENDEYPNRRTTLEKLGTLRAAFKKEGSVTAGNSSGINDGASFVMVASEEAVKKYNLKPLVEIVSIGQGGVDPSIMGMGPVPAIKQALKNADMKLSEIDLLELNEAFAAQSLGVVTELVKQHDLTKEEIIERTNVNGGAIALGHPVGASGNRILVTLIHEMKKRNNANGLASLCIGGGMGTAIIVKNMEE
ncbi:Acetyl-CoA acetyltransferase [Candidatus Izimaplasma bacterium HR1]|uniref:acetyl-CoA C-acetyltransferase n=1 Tax=Candidatus Izimoplasma sp. HR1 TaxID=1541959 RepID=UPI0004F5D21A|nr:Acetyl-CoA acetyltransferase [Candidatus Izimaplasma bacterium HR1]